MNSRTTRRTKTYFEWGAIRQNHWSKEVATPDGGYIEVLGRELPSGVVQVFVGVYTEAGEPIREDYQQEVKAPVEKAMIDGIKRGQEYASAGKA